MTGVRTGGVEYPVKISSRLSLGTHNRYVKCKLYGDPCPIQLQSESLVGDLWDFTTCIQLMKGIIVS